MKIFQIQRGFNVTDAKYVINCARVGLLEGLKLDVEILMEGLETGKRYRGHFNVVNKGVIDNLDDDAIKKN